MEGRKGRLCSNGSFSVCDIMSLPTLRANAHRPERSCFLSEVRVTVFNTTRSGNRRWSRGGFRRLRAGDTGDSMKRSVFHLPVMAILAFHLAPLSPIHSPTHIEPITRQSAMAPVPGPSKAVEASVTSERVETTPTPIQSPVVTARPPSGSHTDWMAAAGIPQSDWQYVDWIVTRESGWRPGAVNPYGCIGLGQNCPDKNGNLWLVAVCPNWRSDPVCQLRRFTVYAQGRYGGWAHSVIAWQRQGWW